MSSLAELLCHITARPNEIGGEPEDLSSEECVGTVPHMLVSLLHARRGATVANAALAVGNLSQRFARPYDDSLREAGSLVPLVRLLSHHGAAHPSTEAAARALFNLAANDANQDAIRVANGIPPLVALLGAGPESAAATKAAGALFNLAANDTNKVAIRGAGGIPPLVALLRARADTEAAENASGAMNNLSADLESQVAILKAGGIPLLVALLDGGAESEAAENAASALSNLATNPLIRGAIREAGGIPPLVGLLSAGGESEAAQVAASTLFNLCQHGGGRGGEQDAAGVALFPGCRGDGQANREALLESLRHALPRTLDTLERFRPRVATADGPNAMIDNTMSLCGELRETAAELLRQAARYVMVGNERYVMAVTVNVTGELLRQAEAGTDVGALELAIERAQAVRLAAGALERARTRLSDINGETRRRARREALGLGSIVPPEEFLCPITMERMRDPVVASDGNSYERSAIQQVLRSGHALSPLTREPLRPDVLIVNRNLRKRIESYEGEVLDFAAQAADTAAGRAFAAILGELPAGKGGSEGTCAGGASDSGAASETAREGVTCGPRAVPAICAAAGGAVAASSGARKRPLRAAMGGCGSVVGSHDGPASSAKRGLR